MTAYTRSVLKPQPPILHQTLLPMKRNMPLKYLCTSLFLWFYKAPKWRRHNIYADAIWVNWLFFSAWGQQTYYVNCSIFHPLPRDSIKSLSPVCKTFWLGSVTSKWYLLYSRVEPTDEHACMRSTQSCITFHTQHVIAAEALFLSLRCIVVAARRHSLQLNRAYDVRFSTSARYRR